MSKSRVRIVAVGDVCPGDHYFTMGHGVRSNFEKDPDGIFSDVSGQLGSADISFLNLEGVISDSGLDPKSFKSFAFRGSPAMAKALSAAGFNVANIANNHMMQHGKPAFEQSVALLREAGIAPLGLKSSSEFSTEPVIIEAGGARVGILGYSLVPEQYSPDDISYAPGMPEAIKKDVRSLKKSVDHLIVSCHCGIEAMDRPSRETADLARSLINCGCDLFLGHHPHVFQPVELYKKGVILYSLGNFLSDFFWGGSFVHSGIAEVTLGGAAADVKIHPVRTNRACHVVRDPGAKINSGIYTACEGSGDVHVAGRSYEADARKALKLNDSRKNIFFFKNLPYGRTGLKLGFLKSKLNL